MRLPLIKIAEWMVLNSVKERRSFLMEAKETKIGALGLTFNSKNNFVKSYKTSLGKNEIDCP